MKATFSVTGVLFSAALLTASQSGQNPTVFRSGADAVFANVSVLSGRRPVLGLSAKDFEIQDNGVTQTVDDASIDTTTVDVSLLLDLSGSAMAGPFRSRLVDGAKQVLSLLRTGDRAELVVFDSDVRRSLDLMREPPQVSLDKFADGGTRLFDAISAALIERVEPGHRHLIIAITDGIDNQSLVSGAIRKAVIDRSSATVYIAAVSILGRTSNFYFQPAPVNGTVTREVAGDYDYLLKEFTDGTGGEFFDLRPGDSFAESLRGIVDAFRQSYVIRYQPDGVTKQGWHEIEARVKGHRYDVHVRKRYFGG